MAETRVEVWKSPLELEVELTPGKSAMVAFIGAEPDLVDVDILEAYMAVIRRVVEVRTQMRPETATATPEGMAVGFAASGESYPGDIAGSDPPSMYPNGAPASTLAPAVTPRSQEPKSEASEPAPEATLTDQGESVNA